MKLESKYGFQPLFFIHANRVWECVPSRIRMEATTYEIADGKQMTAEYYEYHFGGFDKILIRQEFEVADTKEKLFEFLTNDIQDI